MGGSPVPVHILIGGFCLFTTHINGEGREEWEGREEERKEGREEGRKEGRKERKEGN